MDTSQTKVVDLAQVRKRAELQASVKALMSALAGLSGEIKRLERIFRHGK